MIYLTYAKTERKSAQELVRILDSDIFGGEYVDAILKRKNPESVNESLCGLLLLQKALTIAGNAANGYRIRRKENGRPYFENTENVDFSISHSENAVACALSTDGKVGLDVEKICAAREMKRLAERFFSEKENKVLEGCDDYEESWTEIWTRKEAYIKYSEGSFAKLADADTENAENVRFYTSKLTLIPAEEYFLTLCTAADKYTEPEIQRLEFNE